MTTGDDEMAIPRPTENIVQLYELTESHKVETTGEIRFYFNPFTKELMSNAAEEIKRTKIFTTARSAVSVLCHNISDGKIVSKFEMDDMMKFRILLDELALTQLFVRIYNGGENCYAKFYVHR